MKTNDLRPDIQAGSLLERAVESVRRHNLPPGEAEAVRQRAWQRIERERSREQNLTQGVVHSLEQGLPAGDASTDPGMQIKGCADVRALRKAYRAARLSDAREMLVQAHLRECAGCRAVFADTGLARMSAWKTTPASAAGSGVRPRTALAFGRGSLRGYLGAGALAAALLLAAVWLFGDAFRGTPGGFRATLVESDGPVYVMGPAASAGTAGPGGLRTLARDGELAEREWLRTPRGSRAVIRLRDGSRVELKPHTELGVSMSRKDITVHLERGSIIVRAPERRDGHLMVVTEDATSVVTGTLFSVNRGTKGTRVSVIEGQARVEYRGEQRVLGPGGQLSTSRFVDALAIGDEVAWSSEAERHVASLTQAPKQALSLNDEHWDRLRYTSKLLPRLPRETLLYVAIPNYRDALRRAPSLIEQHLRDNPALARWSDDARTVGRTARPADVAEPIRLFAELHEYLGDEIVLALVPTVPAGNQAGNGAHNDVRPLIVAEVKRPGLRPFLERALAKLGAAQDIQLIDDPAAPAAPGKRPELVVLATDSQLALAADRADLLRLGGRSGQPGGGFADTAFGGRVADRYRDGAGLLFAADLAAITAQVPAEPEAQAVLRGLGAQNVKSFIVEQESLGKITQNRASLDFGGPRTGVASWLDAPAPMATLDFVGPEASFAAAFIVKQPALVLDDLLRLGEAVNPRLRQELAQLEAKTGVQLRQDLAATLGNDVVLALDGPLVPVPSWKVVMETYDPDRLTATLERLVAEFNRVVPGQGGPRLMFERKPSGRALRGTATIVSDTYTIRVVGSPFEIHLAFIDGYLVMAPNDQMLYRAGRTRQSGRNLRTSWRFRDLLPPDREANFSALVYHNLGEAAATVGELVSGGRALTAEQEQTLDQVVKAARPGLVCVYGGSNDIQVASAGGLFGLTLDQVTGSAGLFDLLKRR